MHSPPRTPLTDADVFSASGIIIEHNDCRTAMGQLADAIASGTRLPVHAVLTSPPYPASVRDYGVPPQTWGGDEACSHEWANTTATVCVRCGAWRGVFGTEACIDCGHSWQSDRCGQCYLCHLLDVFRLVRRVLRPDGVVWLNLGDTFASDSARHAPYRTKQCIHVAALAALALQADGWWSRAPLIPWVKLNPIPGPWTDRPVVGHEWWLMLTPSSHYWYDPIAVRQPFADRRQGRDGSGQRVEHWGGHPTALAHPGGIDPSANGGRNWRTTDPWQASRAALREALQSTLDALDADEVVWTAHDVPLALQCAVGGSGKGAHFATFPERLIAPLIAASVPPLVCSACGTPWRRIVDEQRTRDRSVGQTAARGAGQGRATSSGRANRSGRVWTRSTALATDGWQPTCGCACGGAADDGWLVASPCAGDGERDDPTPRTGRAGLNRRRTAEEGRRLLTRKQQRAYAEQLRASPHRAAMAAEAGPAFAHYLRTDYPHGARAVPPALLDAWLARGWLIPVAPPDAAASPPPVGGTVLDPFAGLGTTLVVAAQHERRAIGFEVGEAYVAVAHARVAAALAAIGGRDEL